MEKYKVTGMSCAACSARVEKAVKRVDGVKSVSVNLLTGDMGVEGGDSKAVIDAVIKAGYGAALKGDKSVVAQAKLPESGTKSILTRLIVSAVVLLILMYFSMGVGMWGFPLPAALERSPLAVGIIQLLLSATVLVINQRFFISGAKAAIRLSPNMDTLVALGSAASFAYSAVRLVAMASGLIDAGLHGLYFESAAMILVLITVGKTLEAHAKGKTTAAVKQLVELSPRTATVIRDGKEIVVEAESVRVGEIFIVRSGERIPVDGEVKSGNAAVDESVLTGESVPAEKGEGARVFAATTLKTGYLECVAQRVGADTALSEIVRLVEDAAATKAPIAKIADKVSGVFVPVVLTIALITTIVWLILGTTFAYALSRGVSVLVISCPCALGLATPVAITVGSGVGARRGLLFKTAEALEITGKVKTVLVDKTGTLTVGKPIVSAVVNESEEMLGAAYALEKMSEHPLATAIVRYCESKGAQLKKASGYTVHPGGGVSGIVGNEKYYIGNARYIAGELGIALDGLDLDGFAQQGKTPVIVAKSSGTLGVFALEDELRADSVAAVSELRRMGLSVVMLTGDNAVTAAAVAQRVGVDEVIAGVLPSSKADAVEKAKSNGAVAMVGDGINDAVALTAADIGMAIGAGTDIAVSSASVVLTKSSLNGVVDAIRLSRATVRNIKQNLFWAFVYNIIGIPLAAGVFVSWLGWELSPMIGAAAMSVSSALVVLNALRLNFFGKASRNKKMEDKKMEKVYKVEGMMCPHCEARAKQAVEAIDGVVKAEPNHKKKRIAVTFAAEANDAAVKSAIESAGYKFIG